ncbi:zinc finger MYM-type protein 1-like [Aphis gossypii]|uniref:zinc finger MYM-type protein 1-like n=1 Tax=Aphis gossypii TaxID=80765 RepID=UPI0021598818|nr:zinc finger MYM-type protein 1-like [Aphis gossypii]XP_050066184.1 zinc finger MYM-type protein 1-like [Aphis gossypii]
MYNPTVLENSNNSNDGENILLEANNDNILVNVDQFKAPRIDSGLLDQINDEVHYWKNVLKRVFVVVKSLAIRGLEFRSDSDKIGSSHNGNFLMSMELIAHFDPFLASHISKYGNKGKGSTTCLSFHTYEQFITLMSDKVLENIIKEVQTAKYFSVVVDSTPDISNSDQLSFVQRYVLDGHPKERFLCFLENTGHKSEKLADDVLTTLALFNIDLANMRGQSYDNASNMSEEHYQKPSLRCEAKGILKKLNRFECALMAVFWGDILEVLNKTSKTLQSVSTDLITVVQLYDSVIHYMQSVTMKILLKNYLD